MSSTAGDEGQGGRLGAKEIRTRGGMLHQKNLSHSVCLSRFGARVYRSVHGHAQLLFLIY